MATSQKKPTASKKTATKSLSSDNNDLETELPLSEKDEVKKAERRTNKAAKKST
jgi:alkyl sulfatase BDS1-like metallo-beta-lactamase superfamily hydrolase